MPINVSDLANLRQELQRDLDAIERVERLMNGKQLSSQPESASPPPRGGNPNSSQEEEAEGSSAGEATELSLVATIAKVIKDQPHRGWTTNSIERKLKDDGYELKAAKPIYSIGQALRKLVDRGEINLSVKGSGSQPNVYRAKRTAVPRPTMVTSGEDGVVNEK